jgi:hypothetical protein
MKKINLFKGALAFAAASVIGASAHAQTLSTNQGDVFFNMYATAGNGTAYDYEVDLGNFSNFLTGGVDATGSPVSLTNVSITDISGNSGGQGFGSLWDSDGDVNWSVVGAQSNGSTKNGVLSKTIFATDSVSLANFSTGTQTASGQIGSYVIDVGNENLTPTANSGGEGVFDPDTYYYSLSGQGSAPFFGQLPQTFESTANGTETVGFYEVLNANHSGNASEVGTFTLSSSGLTFQSVPEPSTWATMIAGAATLLGFSRRRRFRKA